ncbi:P-loop containing nucleoside triphosphate hydrolase protein [Lipomyces tetrasporus]|uniref:P-loop containing nucleoside triphosphate hydrolase protein n=1 Tax=Lipomyces tetrasporus TaxID=54092 RepID=A0AAD7QMS6_9ASCO|nr:P-loop containing nucleoside triphosphate hydrolase protein [Lipomyces tetrasporus]KAJ8098232.1 P-loop containing nucleoside triphosphate hydrolase protein [Lipomyces tetrasporus]
MAWTWSTSRGVRAAKNDEKLAATENSPLLQQGRGDKAVKVPEQTDEFSHLSPHESDILRKQVLVRPVSTNFFSLFRYATKKDRFVLGFGFLLAIVSGTLRPLMTVLVGDIAQLFVTYRPQSELYEYRGLGFNETSGFNSTDGYDSYPYPVTTPDEFQRQINRIALIFVGLGVTDLIASTINTYIFIDRGEVLSSRIRKNYLDSTLRQNIAYFDKLGTGEITTRISTDTLLVQEGMSEKVGQVSSNITTFISALLVAFTRSWKLTLILICITLSVLVTMTVASRYMVKFYRKSLSGYSVGGTIAEEVLSSIRNVQAFAIADRLAGQYDEFLAVTEKWGHKAGMVLGFMSGMMWFFMYCNYALAFFQGSRFIASGYLQIRQVMSVLMSMMMGSFFLSSIPPLLRHIANGIAASSKIYSAIDRDSAVDPFAPGETFPESEFRGKVEFSNLKFIYPSRVHTTVLENFNLTIEAGKTVALVGASGSGKSTIIGILGRLYNHVGGHVYVDGHDITKLNVEWLRQHISLVSQEPVLFACSIFENIAYGLIGTRYETASRIEKEALVIDACKKANAWTFIEKLPLGWDTQVGERGFLMSGGQKQRIAIARAIVSNPKILLLDEATSALDTKSEGIVQKALDAGSKGRTTIVIAHRLSTIKDADMIVVMSKGKILETGNHSQLIAKQGEYYELVKAQQIEALKEKQDEDDADSDETEFDAESDLESEGASSSSYESSSYYKENEKSALTLSRTKTGRSVSSIVIRQKPDVPAPRVDSTWTLMKFLVQLTKKENKYLVIGTVCAAINGLGHPVISILYALSITSFRNGPAEYDTMLKKIGVYAGVFFALGWIQASALFLCNATLSFVGQRLVRRIRYQTFRHIARQDMAFFDKKENSTGKLTAVLSQDAQSVEGLSGATLGQIMNAVFNIVAGSILALCAAPKMAGVFIGCVPLMVGCGYGRFSMLARVQEQAKQMNEKSAAYACEAVSSVRTVISLTRERDIVEAYEADLAMQARSSRLPTFKSAALFGTAQGLQFLIMGLGFWWGSRFIYSGEYSVAQFYIAFMSSIFGAQNAGIVFSYAADMTKAKSATQSIKNLFDREPEIDEWSDEGKVFDPEQVEGDIEFRDVHFRYPTRPSVPVLRGLNLRVKKGQYVALVGSSGCGKSTTIGLIEEFYRPLAGQVLFDGHDVNTLNINNYRSHIALVQQEPVLYAATIRENIKLGSLENPDNISDERIVDVCKQSNIHDFIASLPEGYDTLCGTKGVLLSGGQKQRIAIARALIRQPKVLLLDEATSALDSESEKVVQAALDQAAKGRTTIAVAHRLSTIQNADKIYVFEGGKVLEEGTHFELLAKRGKYYDLVQAQSLEGAE